ncbi:MAG: helix-turn-helix domain-containing protein [Acidisphaera sp.]|nr:helix-turn-helix domain-containing protein [Acidisphaera sp.]
MLNRRSDIADADDVRPLAHQTDAADASGATVRVGAELREARERLGWTLPAISATLRIRLPYLEAIEAGRLSELPGNAYAVGFLRTYAQALGLDPDEIARRFRAEAADVNRKTELAFPAPVPERGIPAGAIVLVGAVIAILAYIGWYRFSEVGSGNASAVQPVPARLARPAEKPITAAPATSAPVAAVQPPLTAASAQSDRAAVTPPPPVAPAPAPAKEAMGPPIPPGIAKTLAANGAASSATAQLAAAGNLSAPPSPPSLSPPVVAPAAVAGGPDGPRLQVKAIAESWVQVREKQGSVLLNRVLRSGEVWPVPNNKGPLLMTTGNAGGTALIVDGTAQAPLGADGAVRRDIPLDMPAGADARPAPTTRTN